MLNKDKVLLEEAYFSIANKPSAEFNDVELLKEEDEFNDEPVVLSIEEPVDMEETDWQEHEDEEIRMTKTNLFTLNEDSKIIFNALEDGEVIEPWMLQKIAVAAEMLCGVAKVVRYSQAKSQAGL